MITLQEAVDKLVAEGDVEQVAQYLVREGWRGVRNCKWRCVLASYFSTLIERTVTVTMWTAFARRPSEIVQLPEALQQLVTNFDHGCYPRLEHPY